jgi:DNA-binding PadR family transcriptional regulator
MAKRSGVLEYAVLGLLQDAPMHGYELRKRLNGVLGSFRAISYGSLYPCLRSLVQQGLIVEDGPADAGAPALSGRRAKIVYRLTAEGKERFQEWLAQSGPETWEDDRFGVHLAFFGRTDAEVRMRILQGRRSRLEERLSLLRDSAARSRERLDNYTLQLQQHGLESVEREVRWLGELIENENSAKTDNSGSGTVPAARE